MDKLQKAQNREYFVRKANELIQRASNTLNYNEQKVFCYIVSLIKPGDDATKSYTFTINNYCEICGIGKNNNKTIRAVKGSFEKLCNTFFIEDENGRLITTRWIDNAIIDKGSGTITVTFHKLICKYLFGIESNYTQYRLLSILPMKSTYSIKIYEILKSYSGFSKSGSVYKKEIELYKLKKKLGVVKTDEKTKEEKDTYKNFKDFRNKVLQVAETEINLYTDLIISWETAKQGRKVIAIIFNISKKKGFDYTYTQIKNNAKLEEKK